MDREKFLTTLSLSLSSFVGLLVAVPVIGSLIAPFFVEKPPKWRSVGSIDKFKVGDTTLVKFQNTTNEEWAGATGQTASWLHRKSQNKFIAFSINCTHLGCPVRWESDAQLFMCPCHGGIYYKDGSNAAGPPPRPLQRYPVRLKNGQVQILTSPVPITNITD